MRIWLPYADWPQLLNLPECMQADVFEGFDAPPPSIAEVELFVMPYLAGTAPARLMADMPSLRVAQTLTAGVDDVRPLVPEGVTLCNAKGVHDASTAELAVALALAALRGIPDHVRAAERGSWCMTRGRRWPTGGCCSWATARWARRSSGGWPASSARCAGWRAGRGPAMCRSSRSRRWRDCCRGPRS